MKKIIGILFVLLLSFWVLRPLLGRGYFPMHDDTQVARVVEMGRALRQGQFPVRWVSDLGYGYGYPLFNFYGPLPYYAGGVLYAFGVDSVAATKWMFAIGILLSGITMYCLLEPVFGLLGAVAGSMLFLYAPYHAVEVYVRGSVGEYWAIAFVPMVVRGMWLVLKEKCYTLGMVLGSLGLSAVILSHAITGFLSIIGVCTAMILYGILRIVQKKFHGKEMIASAVVVCAGLGISAFFWLPAWLELPATSVMKMISGAPNTFFDHFVCPLQLWNSPWGYAGSAPWCIDGMSFKLGKAQILAFAIAVLLLLFIRRRQRERTRSLVLIGMMLTIVSIVLLLDISKPFWILFPYVSLIQYPWRLLSFSMLGMAIVGGYSVAAWQVPMIRIGIAVVLIWGTIALGTKMFQPQYLYARDSAAFEAAEELQFTISKISDEYLPLAIVRPKTIHDIPQQIVSGTGTVTVGWVEKTGTSIRIEVDSAREQAITLENAHFPGWRYFVNSKEVHPEIVAGLPSLVVSEGKSVVELHFTNTPVRMIANFISVITFITIIIFIIIYGKKANA